MLKFVQKKLKEEKGLTLIELLAVIVILGIIAAIAIPAIGNIIENSRYNAVKSDALNALSAANLVEADDPKALDDNDFTIDDLIAGGYLDSAGKLDGDMTIQKETADNRTYLVIDGTSEEYTNGKSVIFETASVDQINADTQKGSADGDKTIPGS